MEQGPELSSEEIPAEAVPAAPASAAVVFGDRLALAEEYALALATDGVLRGLIGPREVSRLWERHILNCAVLGELLEPGETLVDVGSGAGLPGIPVAIARPDVSVILVEPLLRRATFLEEFCAERLPTVTVIRGRAEEPSVIAAVAGADAVTSRAVSGFPKLAPWSAPLLRDGGRLLAVKGSRAEDEIAEHRAILGRQGLVDPDVVECGVGVIDPATRVVRAVKRGGPGKARRKKKR